MTVQSAANNNPQFTAAPSTATSLDATPPSTRSPYDMLGSSSLGSYEHSRRQVSSVILSEEIIGEVPVSGHVRYIEIPVYESVTKHVPKRKVVDVEKIVPVYEYEYVERIVEVPRVQYVDKTVVKEQIQEIVVRKPVKIFQDVPVEVVRTVPKIETVNIEKVVEVPGEIIEVPKPYVVENTVPVRRFQDENVALVVAQTIQPVITESSEVVDVDVYEYEPQLIPVDIHVAKPVAAHLVAIGAVEERHQVVNIPSAQYNSTLRSLNMHLSNDYDALPFIKEGDSIPFLGDHEIPGTLPPSSTVSLQGMNESFTDYRKLEQHESNFPRIDHHQTTLGSSDQYEVSCRQNYRVTTSSGEPIETTLTTGRMESTYGVSKKSTVDTLPINTQSYHKRSVKSAGQRAGHRSIHHPKQRGCRC